MLISHKHRFVFLHNPKVGGTSIRDPLEPHCEVNLRKKGVLDNEVQDITHLRVEQWTPEIVNAYKEGYYFFGTVKDPVDKFMSAISEITYQHEDFLNRVGVRGAKQLETFLRDILNESIARRDWRFVHFVPQWCYFGLTPDDILPGIDIFHLEKIDQWWPTLSAKLGIDLPDQLPNIRRSYHKPAEISDATKQLISSIYYEDFQKFGYKLPVERPCLKATSAQRMEHIAKFGWNAFNFGLANLREEAMVESAKKPMKSAAMMWLRSELMKRV